jgi:hypothetical protein
MIPTPSHLLLAKIGLPTSSHVTTIIEYAFRSLFPSIGSSHDIEGMQRWYEKFGRTCAEFGVQWEDIWNFDETGFSIGVGGVQKVVTRIKNRKIRFFHPDPECRQHVSACE